MCEAPRSRIRSDDDKEPQHDNSSCCASFSDAIARDHLCCVEAKINAAKDVVSCVAMEATMQGNFRILEWSFNQGVSLPNGLVEVAVLAESLPCLQLIMTKAGSRPYIGSHTARRAARCRSPDCLQYLHSLKMPLTPQMAEDAATYGRVEILKNLHAHGGSSFPDHVAGLAATHGHLEAMEFLISCGQRLDRADVNFRIGLVPPEAPKLEMIALCMLRALEHGVQLTRAEWRNAGGRRLTQILRERRTAFLLCFAEARHVSSKGRALCAAAEWGRVIAMQAMPLDLLSAIVQAAGLSHRQRAE